MKRTLLQKNPGQARLPERILRVGLGMALCLGGPASCLSAGIANDSSATNRPFSLAFTSKMFTEVNENDARAARKVWILTVGQDRGNPVDPEPRIYPTLQTAMAASRTNAVDGFALTMDEYGPALREMRFDRIALGVHNGSVTESYDLLVHRDSGLTDLQQLEKSRLTVLQSPRMSLAIIWLDTLLLQKGLKRANEFCGRPTFANKATKVALPVCFRADFRSPYRNQILEEMQHLTESPAGQQILTLTQSDGIEERPLTCLDSVLELLSTHHRLGGDADGVQPGGLDPRPGVDPPKGRQ